MDSLIAAKAVLKGIVLPPASPLILAALGWALASRFPRVGRALIIVPLAALFALSLPAVSIGLLDLLEPPPPFAAGDLRGARAIVILGGGIRFDAPDYPGGTVSTLTLERVRYGARVAKLTHLPILVSGGTSSDDAPSEASLMQRVLQEEFGVPVRWLETDSTNTHENAVYSAALLKKEGIDTIVLVMHAFDMRRATRELNAQGMTVIPAATNLPATGESDFFDYVPSFPAFMRSYYACYEILANAVLTLGLRGRAD